MTDSPTTLPAATAPTPSRRRRRWLRRLLLAVVGLLVVIAVLVQVLLWSDIPRQVVENQASRLLGLHVRIDKLQIGWNGHVRMDGVSFTLPGEDEPLLRLPRASARTTPLWLLPFTQQVHSVRLERPHLQLEQSEDLEWNLERAARRIARGAVPARKPGTSESSPAAIPNLEVLDGSVEVRSADGRAATLHGITASLNTNTPLRTTVRLDAKDNFSIRGSYQPGSDWRHELTFEINQVPNSLRLLIEGMPRVVASGRWDGRLSTHQLVGRLDLRSASVGDLRLSGKLPVTFDDAVQVDLSSLKVEDAASGGLSARLVGGTVRYESGTVFVRNVLLWHGSGSAVLSGRFEPARRSGSMSLAARNIAIGDNIVSGTLDATLTTSPFGGPVLQVAATTTTRTRNDVIEGSFRVHAEGESFRRLSWSAEGSDVLIGPLADERIPSWTAGGSSEIGDDGRTSITLDHVTVSGAPGIRARGGLVLAATGRPEQWWLWSNGENLSYRAPRVGRRPLGYDVHLDGVGGRATIRSLHLLLGDAIITGQGSFDPDRQLDSLRLQLNFQQFTSSWGTAALEPRLLRGAIHADLVVVARLQPLDFRFFGRLAGNQVRYHQTRLGQFLAILEGNGNADGLIARTSHVRLFGGGWDAEIRVPRSESTPIAVQLSGRHVKLPELARAFRLPTEPAGVGAVQLRGTIAIDPRFTNIAGVAEIDHPRYLSLNADRVRVNFQLADNQLRLEPDATLGAGSAAGSLTAELDRLDQWTVAGTLRDWPILSSDDGSRIAVSASTDRLLFALSDVGPLLTGRLDADVLFALPRQREGRLKGKLSFRRQRTEVLELGGELLGASISGNGVLNLERIDDSVLNVSLVGLDAGQLAAAFPAVKDLSGKFDASLRLSPPTVSRPTGPLEAELRLRSTEASFRGVPIGDGVVMAHLSTGSWGSGPSRVSVDQSELAVAGGKLRLFARVTHVPTESELRTLANLEIDGLRLEELSQSAPDSWRDVVGRLDGAIDLFGDPRQLQTIDIRGRLSAREARLSSLPALRGVFALANAGPAPSRPSGTADVSFRLEQDRLVVPQLTVFDRGTYVEGYAIELSGISRWPETELAGYALASARPLRDIRVPVLSALINRIDEVISALQREVTAIRVEGSVAEPAVRQVNLAEIYDGVRGLFGR